jgi:hypothetical protein
MERRTKKDTKSEGFRWQMRLVLENEEEDDEKLEKTCIEFHSS